MATERSYVSYATAAVAVAAIPLSFVGPEGLRLAVIGLLMLAGPGTALVLLLRGGIGRPDQDPLEGRVHTGPARYSGSTAGLIAGRPAST